jgi:hypothetical protein
MTKKEVETTTGGEVGQVVDWQAEMAAAATASAANVRPVSSTISLKSGIVSYQGTPAPDNKLDVVIIGFAQEHALYRSKYDADNVTPPDCYALADGGVAIADITPADNVASPESPSCGGCPMLEWGSSLNGGRGKACQQRYKLIAVPASAMESPDALLAAEVATIKLPVTSGKIWGQYIQTVASIHSRPEWGVVTTIGAKPDAKTQFKAVFEVSALIDFDHSPELFTALRKKQTMARDVLMQGYDLSTKADDGVNENSKAGR